MDKDQVLASLLRRIDIAVQERRGGSVRLKYDIHVRRLLLDLYERIAEDHAELESLRAMRKRIEGLVVVLESGGWDESDKPSEAELEIAAELRTVLGDP